MHKGAATAAALTLALVWTSSAPAQIPPPALQPEPQPEPPASAPVQGPPDDGAPPLPPARAPATPPAPTGTNRFPPGEDGFGPRMGPRYATSRWAEDWSFLRDRAKRKDLFDPLKYIPFDADGSAYLTLNGQSRLRYETYSNRGLREVPLQDNLLLRTFAGADLHLGEHVRVYGEIASGQQWGSSPINANQRNDLAIQQLFGEVRGKIAGAQAGVIFGRQYFLDGPIPLVSTRENTNIHITLQGVRGYARWARVRAQLFRLRVVDLGLGAFDDHVGNRRFDGGVLSFVVSPASAKKPFLIDPFYFHSAENRTWGGVSGREKRDFYGVRAHGPIGPASIDWTVAYQTGNFAGRPLRAWSVFTDQSIALSESGWRPQIGFHADASSGGGAYEGGTLRNADSLFGVLPYLSDGLSFGFINLMDVSPTATFTPVKNVTVRSELNFLWRTRAGEAVYSGTKAPYAGTQNVPGRDVGRQARLRIAWAINPHITLAGTFEHVFAGDVLKRAGFSDSTFTATQLQFKF